MGHAAGDILVVDGVGAGEDKVLQGATLRARRFEHVEGAAEVDLEVLVGGEGAAAWKAAPRWIIHTGRLKGVTVKSQGQSRLR